MLFPERYRSELGIALNSIDLSQVGAAIELLGKARDENRRIFICGNGGSASTASHFATEMVKGASFGRPKRFRVITLSDSLSTITAYANDVGYESVFVEQLKNFAEPGDVLIAVSSSGNSPNVLRAVEYANSIGCRTIGLSGRDGGLLGKLVAMNIQVAHPHLGRVEDVHFVVLHMIAYYFMESAGQSQAAV